jgi:hypothetical protein
VFALLDLLPPPDKDNKSGWTRIFFNDIMLILII